MSLPEVAEYLGMAERTIYLWAQQGKIPAFKVAGKWRVREEALEAWIRQQAAEAEEGLDFSEGLLP